jgi:hypothetical protein
MFLAIMNLDEREDSIACQLPLLVSDRSWWENKKKKRIGEHKVNKLKQIVATKKYILHIICIVKEENEHIQESIYAKPNAL